MAGIRPNGRSKPKHPPFVMLRYNMMESPAWASLSAHAQALWPYIKKRYRPLTQDNNGDNNNGEIPLSVREAAIFLNCSKGRAKQAFDELQEKGFIKIGRDSKFSQKCRHAREWTLTSEPLGRNVPTNDWKNYKTV